MAYVVFESKIYSTQETLSLIFSNTLFWEGNNIS